MKGEILLVEDEQNFGMVLKNYLELSDYSVDLAPDGDLGFVKFKSKTYDIVILDVMMPGRDGFTLARDIRKLNSSVPLIFLTARGEKADLVAGYRSGADDYLTKPFDTDVLLLKIEATLSRKTVNAPKQEEIRLASFHYFPAKRELSRDGETTRLSPKENALLELLHAYANKVMPRSEALHKIWQSDDYFTTRSMDVYVAKLRKKLAADERLSIENIHGSGYVFHVLGDA